MSAMKGWIKLNDRDLLSPEFTQETGYSPLIFHVKATSIVCITTASYLSEDDKVTHYSIVSIDGAARPFDVTETADEIIALIQKARQVNDGDQD